MCSAGGIKEARSKGRDKGGEKVKKVNEKGKKGEIKRVRKNGKEAREGKEQKDGGKWNIRRRPGS